MNLTEKKCNAGLPEILGHSFSTDLMPELVRHRNKATQSGIFWCLLPDLGDGRNADSGVSFRCRFPPTRCNSGGGIWVDGIVQYVQCSTDGSPTMYSIRPFGC